MFDLSQQLVTAIQAKSLANVQEILAVTHDSTLFAITTPVVHHALKPDMFDIFSLLVKRKFNFAVKDADQDTVLYKVLVSCLHKHGKMLLEQMIKCDGYEAVYKELTVIKKSAYFNLETNIVATHGLLDFVEWCHENNKPFNENAMDCAAGNGYLDVVKYLDKNRKNGCTCDAMDLAANDGHLDIVKYLHENRKEGCTTWAMDWAAAHGHLDTLRWLHENRTEGCTTSAMDRAAGNGHLDILKWLHEHNMKCTADAMSWAAMGDHLDVCKYLFEHVVPCGCLCRNSCSSLYSSSCGCPCKPWTRQDIDDAIDKAIDGVKKRPDVVAYLTSVRPADPIEKLEKAYFDGLSINAYDNFVKNNNVVVNHAQEIVKQLTAIQDYDNLLALLELPRYANVNSIYLVNIITLLQQKQDTKRISKFLIACSDKVSVDFLVYTAIDIENYDLIKQFAKKYKDDVNRVLLQAPKELLSKYLTYFYKK